MMGDNARMKVGMRTPSIKKSIKARTTGKYKRRLKRLTNPFYGKKGIGWIKDPKRALRNKIYHKTTFSAKGLIMGIVNIYIFIIKWMFILSWWLIKYSFLAMVWLMVIIYNGIVSLIEMIMNANREDAPISETAIIEEVPQEPQNEAINS